MGNNRMVLSSDGTIEQVTHYYPYDGVMGDISTNESFQKYKFEGPRSHQKEIDNLLARRRAFRRGVELDRTFGLDNYDIHARQYFAMAPMWDRIDSLAEKLPGVSPYVFCNGDPVNLVDRDGKWVETLWDIANVVMDVKSARDNFSNGEIVSGLVDVGATVLDCIAAIAPGIPGGVGTVVKAARSTDKVTDAVKAVDKGIETTKTVDKGVESAKAVEYGTSAAKQGN